MAGGVCYPGGKKAKDGVTSLTSNQQIRAYIQHRTHVPNGQSHLNRITHTVWSDQKTEKATDLCIKMRHNAPTQVNAMDWKPNLPALDSLKQSIYAIKAHMVPNYVFLKKGGVVCD